MTRRTFRTPRYSRCRGCGNGTRRQLCASCTRDRGINPGGQAEPIGSVLAAVLQRKPTPRMIAERVLAGVEDPQLEKVTT